MENCPICRNKAIQVCTKELNISCGDYFEGRRLFPLNIGKTSLLQCNTCGFALFPEMHKWSIKNFADRIYNNKYLIADAPFEFERPLRIAKHIRESFEPCNLIDFGGGRGVLADQLCSDGFHAVVYDPFHASNKELPTWQADIVTAFEVVEHVANQVELFLTLNKLCKPGGMIVFSTLLSDGVDLSKDWYYASPRNGHISFHTSESLVAVCAQVGLEVIPSASGVHTAVKKLPNFHVLDTPPFSFLNDVFVKTK